MSGGLYSHTTRSVGTILTAAIYNADHQNHITNQNPSVTGGYSDTVSQMQASADPGDVGSESLAASLAGELEAMRFVIARIVDKPNWYEPPDFDLGDIGSPIADGAVTNAKLADMVAATVKGRAAGAVTGVPIDLTAAQLSTILDSVAGQRTGFIHGLTLSNGTDATNDINIAVGGARDSTDAATMTISSILTKRLDAAWAVGTNQGGRDTGSIANDSYHIWLIRRPDTGIVDALFSASPTVPTMPANYTQKRRIGSILRVSNAIVGFTQDGDAFYRDVPVRDVDTDNPGTSGVLSVLSIPAGVAVEAFFSASMRALSTFNSQLFALITSPAQTDTAPNSTLFDMHTQASGGTHAGYNSSSFNRRTDTSARIRYRLSASTADITMTIVTHGWKDTRGRLA